jgi:hypothetical protein
MDETFFVTTYTDDGTTALDIREVDAGSDTPILVSVGGQSMRLSIEQLYDVVAACDEYLHPEEGEEDELSADTDAYVSGALEALDFTPEFVDPARLAAMRQARELLGEGPWYDYSAAITLAAVARFLMGEEG